MPSMKPFREKSRKTAAVWMRMCLRCSEWYENVGMPVVGVRRECWIVKRGENLAAEGQEGLKTENKNANYSA